MSAPKPDRSGRYNPADVLTVAEVASRLRLCVVTVRARIKDGSIKTIQIPGAKRVSGAEMNRLPSAQTPADFPTVPAHKAA